MYTMRGLRNTRSVIQFRNEITDSLTDDTRTKNGLIRN